MVDEPCGAFNGARFMVAFVLALSMIVPMTQAATSIKTGSTRAAMTPEVKLVDDYNTWFIGQLFAGDEEKLKAGLSQYITNQTILHEAVSLPWGGTMVGYDGWVRLTRLSDPIWEKVSSILDVSRPTYYQHGNVVLHEVTMTIKATKAAPEPFVMSIVEKFTIENGRIKQIDEFYADTAALLKRFRVLNAIPANP
jgi:hypothetical protein